MKHLFFTALLFVPLLGAKADVARQQNITHYRTLLENSPFTLPPVEVDPTAGGEEQVSAFDDWVLAGILPLGDSHFVTLRHTKEKGKSEMMRGEEVSPLGFQLVEVEQKSNPQESRVKIRYRGKEQWLGFDLKALGVAEPKPIAQMNAKQQKGKRPPGVRRGNTPNNKRKKPVRKPRPRVNIPKK